MNTVTRPCCICRTTVTGRHFKTPNVAVCSKQCQELKERLQAGARPCEWCEVPFFPRERRRRFCGPDCANKKRAHTTVTSTCTNCLEDFEQSEMAAHQPQDATCDSCSAVRRGHRKRRRFEQRSRRKWTKEDVVREHGWTCHLCTYPIDKDAEPKSRWSLSLDHVVPLSEGGTDELSNLKPAHLRCNCIRGTRPVDDVPAYEYLKAVGTANRKKRSKLVAKDCTTCGQRFTRRGRSSYCSDECKKARCVPA